MADCRGKLWMVCHYCGSKSIVGITSALQTIRLVIERTVGDKKRNYRPLMIIKKHEKITKNK